MAERQRGGRRAGAPGKSYANRTDLNVVRALPVSAAPGQQYGEAAAQREAQQTAPMASGALPDQPPQYDHTDLAQQAAEFNPPNVIPLGAPSMRPDEHLMTPPAPQPQNSPLLLQAGALLNSLGDDASPEVKALRNIIAAGQANSAAP